MQSDKCPPLGFGLPPLGYAENSINSSLHNDTINGKLWLCENSPRFHQIVSNKRSKIKISRESMPPDRPSLPHALHTDTYLPPPPPPPPNNSHNLILSPLGQKAERNPETVLTIIPDLNVRAHRSANNVIPAHSVAHNLYTACESLSLASQALDS